MLPQSREVSQQHEAKRETKQHLGICRQGDETEVCNSAKSVKSAITEVCKCGDFGVILIHQSEFSLIASMAEELIDIGSFCGKEINLSASFIRENISKHPEKPRLNDSYDFLKNRRYFKRE